MRRTGLVLLALVAGCDLQRAPEEVVIGGERQVTITTPEGAGLLPILVLDAWGRPIEPLPALDLRVEPAEVARVEGRRILPRHSGHAEVVVTVRGTEVEARYPLDVSLPDALRLVCEPCAWRVGESAHVAATVLAGERPVDGVPVSFSSSDSDVAAVDGEGAITSKSAGKATITARTSDLSATVEVQVRPAPGVAAAAPAEAAAPAPAPSGAGHPRCPDVVLERTWVVDRGVHFPEDELRARLRNLGEAPRAVTFRYQSARTGGWYTIRRPVEVPAGASVERSITTSWNSKDVPDIESCR